MSNEASTPYVQVVIVNWNGCQDTIACTTALARLDYPRFAVTVVDNGSTDDSPDTLSRVPNLELLRLSTNQGFGPANNVAINIGLNRGFEFFWLLNNDTRPDPNALTALVRTAEANPSLGAVGSLVVDMEDPSHVQAAGGGIIRLGRPRHLKQTGTPPQYLFGASMLIRAAALRSVGSFDERFFMYWEDADLSLRIRQAGWHLGVSRASVVRHKGSASLHGRPQILDYHFNRSASLFFRKHSRIALLPLITGTGGRTAKRLLAGKFTSAAATVRGAIDGWRLAKPSARPSGPPS